MLLCSDRNVQPEDIMSEEYQTTTATAEAIEADFGGRWVSGSATPPAGGLRAPMRSHPPSSTQDVFHLSRPTTRTNSPNASANKTTSA